MSRRDFEDLIRGHIPSEEYVRRLKAGIRRDLTRGGSMKLGEASRLYQAHVEAARTDPEDEELREMMEKARRDLEIEWLRHTTRKAA